MSQPLVLEICAGAGGQALGLENAGFTHVLALDNDTDACNTLKMNRKEWDIREEDVRGFSGAGFDGVDLLAGGVPCPPFSLAGKQLGEHDDRDLFPEALRLVGAIRPRAVLLENVKGLATKRFDYYRHSLAQELSRLGYWSDWRLLNASSFGVPQLRPRFVLVALQRKYVPAFTWPEPQTQPPKSVGEAIGDLMGFRGWTGAKGWAEKARGVAPTIVGGSKKHGGPDLGPTRSRQAWSQLQVDGLGIADYAPGPDFPTDGSPKLTIRMVARLQGFPDDWLFSGGKTTSHRQVGNAFPPPVASAVGSAIRRALSRSAEKPKPNEARWVAAAAT
jgi:DNA (cytosine-5)-methyltransferase 1